MRPHVLAAAIAAVLATGPIDHNVSEWYLEPSNVKTAAGTVDCKTVAYYDGKFIVGTSTGKLLYGPSLENLTLSNSAAVVGSNHINHIAYGNGIYVIGTSNGKVYTSTDLHNWSANTQASGFLGTVVNSVKFINEEFVVTGGGATGCKSVDGLNWTDIGSYLAPLYNTSNARVSGIVWDGSRYVVCSGNRRIGYSSSLTSTFTSMTLSTTSTNFQDIAFNGEQYMAVGSSGVIAVSNDLLNWTQDTSLNAYLGTYDLHGVLWDGHKWFIYGQNGKCAYKYPGESWVVASQLSAMVSTRDINEAFVANDKIMVATEVYGIYSTLQSHPVISSTAKHFRIIIASVGSGSYAQMSEVELLDAQGNDLLVPGVVVTGQSSNYGGVTYNSAKLVDDQDSTKWTSDGSGYMPKNEWVSFSMPSDITPVALTIKEGANEPTRMPVAFQLQKSTDGVNWTTIKYVSTQAAWTSGAKRSYALS